MACGVRKFLAGSVVLVGLGSLAACSGGSYFAEREPWRKEAEARCIGSGAVKESVGVVRVKAIHGPGMCGADFPMKVSVLGQPGVLSFGDELRPPGAIPNATPAMPPRWPIAEPSDGRGEPRYNPRPAPRPTVDSRPLPPPPRGPAPVYQEPPRSEPVPLDPPNAGPQASPLDIYDFRRPYGATAKSASDKPLPAAPPARAAPLDPNSPAYDLSPEPYESRRAVGDGRDRPRAPPREPQYDLPPVESRRAPVRETHRPAPLGPSRGPRVAGTTGTVSFTPAATLACPLVSALDNWIATAVQPAAMRWFDQPVAEIRQISAYSCRGMNGNPRARISEHAFGNALDIASFTLADGRRITVKDGWRGSPEEQGFLRDVQGAACERFTTVLAPGSNRFHYDHIHVDLMKRGNGYRACNPRAVSGEEVAARARATYARQGRDPNVTGSVGRGTPKRLRPNAFAEDKVGHQLPHAVPGEDGED
jgi:hypothetical protein